MDSDIERAVEALKLTKAGLYSTTPHLGVQGGDNDHLALQGLVQALGPEPVKLFGEFDFQLTKVMRAHRQRLWSLRSEVEECFFHEALHDLDSSVTMAEMAIDTLVNMLKAAATK